VRENEAALSALLAKFSQTQPQVGDEGGTGGGEVEGGGGGGGGGNSAWPPESEIDTRSRGRISSVTKDCAVKQHFEEEQTLVAVQRS
jgi:hypothetical protein